MSGIIVFDWVCIAFYLIVGAGCLYWGINNLYFRYKIKNRGIRAMATVTNIRSSIALQPEPTFKVTLEYVADYRRQTVKWTARKRTEGETVEIVYLPEKPEKFLITDSVESILTVVACIVLGVLLIYSGHLILYSYY